MLRFLLALFIFAALVYFATRTLEKRLGGQGEGGPNRGSGGPARPSRPVAPDDDPDFLANLDWEQRKRHREQQRGDTSPDSEASGEATDPPAEGESPA